MKILILMPLIQKSLREHIINLCFELFSHLRTGMLHLSYPTKCLHCHNLLPPEPIVLCSDCAALLDLIPISERCQTCFNLLEYGSLQVCQECMQYPSPYKRMAAAFEYSGPAASLVKKLKYSNQHYLAKGMAGFLVAQFVELDWPFPDVIVPMPQSFTRWLERGYNQSALLAEELSLLLNRPVWHVLKRKSGDYSQAALTLKKRQTLDGKSFSLNKKYAIAGKHILIIDDVMTSGSTLKRCGTLLDSQSPASLYALTFCRTS